MNRWLNGFTRVPTDSLATHSERFAIPLVVILMLAVAGATAHAAVTRLTISPIILSFPQQEVETPSAAKNVTLTNPNSSALQIDTVTPSAGDFSVSSDGCSGVLLAPAAKCIVSVIFTPSETGTRTGTLTLTDGAANSPQTVNLTGKGILVKPTFAPTHLAFGHQPVNVASAAQTITLTNPNLVPLAVTSVVLSGDFTLTGDTCSGTQVGAGGTCTFGVIFTPSQTGIRTGKAVITDDAVTPTQSLNLSGTGIIVTPTVSPTLLPFGKVQVGTISPAQTVTLTNSNLVPVVFTSISISGPYAITADSCDGSVPASSNCQVSVTFNPVTDTNPKGTSEPGKLTFVDNGQRTTQIVNLTGIAFGTVSDCHADFHSHRYGYRNRDCHQHRNTSNGDRYADCDCYRHGNRNRHGNANGDCHEYRDSNANRHRYGDRTATQRNRRNGDRHADRDAHSNRNRRTATATNRHGDATDSDCDRNCNGHNTRPRPRLQRRPPRQPRLRPTATATATATPTATATSQQQQRRPPPHATATATATLRYRYATQRHCDRNCDGYVDSDATPATATATPDGDANGLRNRDRNRHAHRHARTRGREHTGCGRRHRGQACRNHQPGDLD